MGNRPAITPMPARALIRIPDMMLNQATPFRSPQGRFRQSGSTLIEFAIIAPVFLLLMIGIIDKVNPVITVNGVSGTSAGMFGNAGDIVVISVAYNWTFATPMMAAFYKDGKAPYVVAATMRNESFGGL